MALYVVVFLSSVDSNAPQRHFAGGFGKRATLMCLYTDGIRYRFLRDARQLTQIDGLSRGRGYRGMLVARFQALAPAEIMPSNVRVHFRDNIGAEYLLAPRPWVVERAVKEAGSPTPYQDDPLAARWRRAVFPQRTQAIEASELSDRRGE